MDNESEVIYRRYTDRLERFETESGIPLKAVYGPEDVKGLDYQRDVGLPGEFPYLRGIYPEGYRKLLWLKSHITAPSDPEEANERFRKQISYGQTGLRLSGDFPTTNGLESDHPLAIGDIGCAGIPLWGLPCMETALKGVPLEGIDYEFAIPPAHGSLYIFAMFMAAAENSGADISKIRGTAINDVLGSHAVRSAHTCPLPLARHLTTDFVEFCFKNMPKFRPIVPCGYNLGETGANSVQQLALVLSASIGYYEDAKNRGLDADDFASRIAFSLQGGLDFFETVCKLRALRRMWARLTKERFKAKKPSSWQARFALRSSGLSLTRQQPVNNIARITSQALAAVLGGANSVDLSGYDEVYCIPGLEAHLINLNIHHILTYELGVAQTVDPLGGSYYVEWLTNKFEEEANKIMKDIEDRGGIFTAIETGWIENMLAQEVLKRQDAIEREEKIVVGVNRYRVPEEQPELKLGLPLYKPDLSEVRTKTLQSLKEFREKRNIETTREALRNLYLTGKERNNLIRPTIEAFKAGATIQEVNGVIRQSWGYSYDQFGMASPPDFINFLG